jgi:hypothetical protein
MVWARRCSKRLGRATLKDAISLWTGEQSELDARLGTGLVDVAITYQPLVHGNQSIQLLPPDELVLYALRPDNPIRS